MPQSLADDRQRHFLASRYGRPAVATPVEGQRHRHSRQHGDGLEPPIDFHNPVLVLPPLAPILTGHYREQIAGVVGLALVEDVLHLLRPFDDEQLTGLLSPIGQIPVPQVILFKVGHVNERHPTRAETEQKHIAGEIEPRAA